MMDNEHSNVSGARSDLDAAYRATRYIAESKHGDIVIRIDLPTPALDTMLAAHGCTEWAFISACNPGSQLLSASENAERHVQLLAAVKTLGLPWLSGHGVPDHPDWQPEISLLILGITKEQATKLAAHFDQNAIVYGSAGLPAKLCYVRGNSP
jgi:hypothetical protein